MFFDVVGTPSPSGARLLEASLRTLERAFPWGPDGLLFTAGWAPGYFEWLLRVPSPIPRAERLSDFELSAIDDYDLCLHFACDDRRLLADIDAPLVHGAPLAGADGQLSVAAALRWRETWTGFVAPACRPPTRMSAGSRPATLSTTERRCSWPSNQGCGATRPLRTQSRSPPGTSRKQRRCRSARCACG